MQAVKFKSVCNRCDEGVYDHATAITEAINNELTNYDYHNPNYLYVDGQKTNRYVQYTASGANEETLVAVYNVFSSAGYMVLINNKGDVEGADIIVVFDADIAPGPEEDEDASAVQGDGEAAEGIGVEGAAEGEEPGDGSPAPAPDDGDGTPVPGEVPAASAADGQAQEAEKDYGDGFYHP